MLDAPARYRCTVCRDRGWIVSRAPDDGLDSGSARPCDCRGRQRGERLLEETGIPERYRQCTLENFLVADGGVAGEELVRARATCQSYVEGFLASDGTFCQSGLLFVGRVGVGKTHLAVAVLRELVRRFGLPGRFVDFTTLVHRMQVSFDPTSEESRRQLLDPLGSVDVLVLDELGAQKPTPFVRDLLYLIVNTRYARRLPTLFTTNFALEAPSARPQRSLDRAADPPDDAAIAVTLEQRIGAPLLSRLFEMARPVLLDSVRDYRREIRMHQLRT